MSDSRWFSEWLKELIEEDKREGLHPVNRGLKAEVELYNIYREHSKRKH